MHPSLPERWPGRQGRARGNFAGQLRIFPENAFGADRPLQHHAGFGHGGGKDGGIVGFPGQALMEQVGLHAPGVQCRLHRRRRHGEIEKSRTCYVGLELPRHAPGPFVKAA